MRKAFYILMCVLFVMNLFCRVTERCFSINTSSYLYRVCILSGFILPAGACKGGGAT